MECTEIKKDDLVLVTDPGPIGLFALHVIQTLGARVIITGVVKDKNRLETAARMGADHVIRVDKSNLLDLVMELTDGRGVDTTFECSGVAAALNDCLSCVKRRGQIIQVGLFGRPV